MMKFGYIFIELGPTHVIDRPTKISCDNATAVQWVKTGKVTEGNHYVDLAYNLPRQLEEQHWSNTTLRSLESTQRTTHQT